ncbi:MAG: ATP-binding protein [Candidatus Oleimicrobiaceae bacterium]
MFSCLRGKFALAMAIVALSGLVAFELVLYRTIGGYLRQQAVRDLQRTTQLAALLVEETCRATEVSSEDLWALSYRLRDITKARVTLIATTGEVLVDSDVGPAGVAKMDNHLARPEVQEAVEKGWGYSYRGSTTMGEMIHYAAMKVEARHPEIGFLRLARYAEHVDAVLDDLAVLMAGGTVFALALVIALAALLSGLVARPLRQMADACLVLLEEGEEPHLPIHRKDEIGQLAMALHHLATKLRIRLEETHKAKALVQGTLDHLDCGVLLVDDRRRVVAANSTVFKILGQEPHPIEAQDLVELVRSVELVATVTRVLAKGGRESGETTMHTPEGAVAVGYVVSQLGQEQTPPQGALVQLHDITERKRLELVRRDFVANASHELKTPLAAIVGYTETLLADWLNLPREQRVRYLRGIRAQAQRLEFLTNDLLTLAESEEKETLNLVPYPVRRLLRDVAEEFAPKAAAKGIKLLVKGDRVTKAFLDPDRLYIVLANLVDNAIKYTDQGGRVTLRAETLPSREVVVEVSDTGIGIDPRYHQRIFERFYRVDKGRSRAMGGTGLGLAIVKHIVERHGGQVRVASELGKGSRFWFSLRAA